MKLIFIDEFAGRQNKNLFGLSFVVIDNGHYRGLCDKFSDALKEIKWPQYKEFKGRFLFSGYTEGGKKLVQVEQTIDFVKTAVDFLSADKNAKCNIVSVYNEGGQGFENYIALLNAGIIKIRKLQNSQKKPIASGKQNACLFYDGFSDGWSKDGINRISKACMEKLAERNYYLCEGRATPVDSQNNCIGVCYADILSHLVCWKIETPNFDKEPSGQQTLFDLGDESTVQQKKIGTVREIISLVKEIKIEKII